MHVCVQNKAPYLAGIDSASCGVYGKTRSGYLPMLPVLKLVPVLPLGPIGPEAEEAAAVSAAAAAAQQWTSEA